jgi:proline-specific peptidase
MTTLVDRYISFDGINTRYQKVGDRGEPIILIHGSGASSEYWYKNIFDLAKQHQVYSLDLVGSGKSDKPDRTYTYDDLMQFVVNFMDALGLSNISLVAASSGGAIALKLALAYPERLNKLVLATSAGLGKKVSLGMRIASIPFLGEILNCPSQQTVKLFIEQGAYNSKLFFTEEFIDLVDRNLSLEILKFQLRTFRTTANFWGMKSEFLQTIRDRLSEIKTPTLIIWGKQDRVIPVEYAQVAVNNIPNANLDLFDRCGHWSYLEYPDRFNRSILKFLATD